MIDKLKKDDDRWIDSEGVSWSSKSAYLQCAVLGMCGCGNPDDVMGYIGDMLEKINKGYNFDYDNLSDMFFIYWANDKDFAEHGTTARCSRLTDEGKEVLSDIRVLQSEMELEEDNG